MIITLSNRNIFNFSIDWTLGQILTHEWLGHLFDHFFDNHPLEFFGITQHVFGLFNGTESNAPLGAIY